MANILSTLLPLIGQFLLLLILLQRPAADLTATEAAPQHRGHPSDLPPGPLLRPNQHSGASDHEVGDNHFMYFCLTSPLGAKHVAYVAIFLFQSSHNYYKPESELQHILRPLLLLQV